MADNVYNFPHENGRSLGAVANDVKNELKDFISTRVQMLSLEMREKATALKASVPALVVAALFGWFAFMLITFALVAWLATAFESQYAWFLAAGIIAVLYLAIAGIAAAFGISELRSSSLTPERTLKVLRQDQVALQQAQNGSAVDSASYANAERARRIG